MRVCQGGTEQPELYNLADDVAESKDLASAQPETVKQLLALYATWNAEQAEPSATDRPANKKAVKKKKKAAAN